MGLLLTGCQWGGGVNVESVNSEDVKDNSARLGGGITIGLRSFDTLNPLLTKNNDYFQFSKLMYDQLFTMEENGETVPSIAEHYQVSNDGYTVSVTIRDNVFWEDGTKLTAKDVANTFNALKFLPEDSAYYNLLRHAVTTANGFSIENFGRAIVFDDRNVDFQFDKPYGNILQILTFPILPSHLMTMDDMVSTENFKVLVSGPFTLEKYEPNKEIVLKGNVNYHQNVPYLNQVTGKIMENQEKIRQAFDAGQLDLMMMDDYTWDSYRSNSNIGLESYGSNDLEMISFNMQAEIFSGQQGKALRQAIGKGINRRRIIDSLYLSQAQAVDTIINEKNSYGLLSSEEVYYDSERSSEILREAGFKDSNNDGWLEFPSGERLAIQMVTNTENYLRRTEAEFIISDLRNIGIRCELSPSVEEEIGASVINGNYQMALYGVQFSSIPDFAALLHSNGIGVMNLSRYGNSEMDALLNQYALKNNSEKQKELRNQMNEIFFDDAPLVPLFYKQRVLIKSEKIDEELNPTVYNVFRGVPNISLSS